MIRALFAILLLTLFSLETARAQDTISGGQINSFTRVTAWDPDGALVTVANAGLFQSGDKIMIWQAKGATISTANNSTYGDILSLEEAGSYTVATVHRVLSGGRIELFCSGELPDFDVSAVVQAIRVPYFEGDVRVTGTLQAQPWSQTTGLGGVIALIAEGTITFDPNTGANARGDGFEAGDESTGAGNQVADYTCSKSWRGGRKGEGVAVAEQAYCRGKLATGGGGGNSHNAGGGGGANFGAGGLGGRPWWGAGPSGFDQAQTQGIGGQALAPYYGAAATDKVFFGGGGGGGNQNNGGITKGGRGGGLIFLSAARVIAGNNTVLDASGSDGDDLPYNNWNDGAAGGGGGGSIVMIVDDIQNASNLTLDASGGRGGDFGRFPGTCHGPGGGGGGGVIYASSGVPAATSVLTGGGRAGLLTDGWSSSLAYPCGAFGQTYGAEPGENGAILAPGAVQSQECRPELKLTKLIDLDAVTLNQSTGKYSLPLRFIVENSGGLDLYGVEVLDDMKLGYGDLFSSALLEAPQVDCDPASTSRFTAFDDETAGLEAVPNAHCPAPNTSYSGSDNSAAETAADVLAFLPLPATADTAGAQYIEPGQGFAVFAEATLDPNADPAATTATNTARVQAWADTDADQLFSDETPISESNTATFTIQRVADLGVTKTNCRSHFEPGSTLRYSVIVSNAGPHSAGNISLMEDLPTATSGQATWTCHTALTSAGACTLSDLSGAVVGGATCPAANGNVPADGVITSSLTLPANSGLQFIITVPISDDPDDF